MDPDIKIAVIKDVTAAAKIPEDDGYIAEPINFRFMANALSTTDEAPNRLSN